MRKFNVGRFVPNAISRRAGQTVLKARYHSPTILFGVGVVGVVATTVTACRATLRVEDILVEAQDQLNLIKVTAADSHTYTDQDKQRDMTVVYIQTATKMAKIYGPSFILGVTSIACLTGSHKILKSRNVALTAAYKGLEKAYDEYRSRVIADQGEEKDREYRYGKESSTVTTEDKNGPKKTKVDHYGDGSGSPYARIWGESTTPSWNPHSSYNLLTLKARQMHANDKLQADGYILLNDVYDILGLQKTTMGAVVGWYLGNGDNYIDFGCLEGDPDQPYFREGCERPGGEILLDFNVDGVMYDLISGE